MEEDPWEIEAQAERLMDYAGNEASRNQALFSARMRLYGNASSPSAGKAAPQPVNPEVRADHNLNQETS